MADWDVVSQTPTPDDSPWAVVSQTPTATPEEHLFPAIAAGAKHLAGDILPTLGDYATGLGKIITDFPGAAKALAMAPVNFAKNQYHEIAQDLADPEAGYKAAQARNQAVLREVDTRPVKFLLDTILAGTGGDATLARGALAATTKGVGFADKLARLNTELIGGVSSEMQGHAYMAGEQGGKLGRAFRADMKKPDYTGMGEEAKLASRQAVDANNAQYVNDLNVWGTAPSYGVPYAPVRQAIADARASLTDPTTGYLVDSEEAHPVLDKMEAEVNKHQNAVQNAAGPAQFVVQTAVSMDKLKQGLGTILNRTVPGTQAHRVALDVYNSLRDTIAQHTPEYMQSMDRFGGDANDIDNAIKSLSLGERATRGTTAGKLMSTARPQTSLGIHASRADDLALLSQFQPTLPYRIAGAAHNPWLPRGLVGRLKLAETMPEWLGALFGEAGLGAAAGQVIGMTGTGLTGALAEALLSSPRTMGNLRYAAGAANRYARKIGATQRNLGLLGEGTRLYGEDQDEPAGLLGQ